VINYEHEKVIVELVRKNAELEKENKEILENKISLESY